MSASEEKNHIESTSTEDDYILGPYRVYPGKLSVTRCFGNAKIKNSTSGIFLTDPEINKYDITDDFDFIFIGCDGVYDHLLNSEIINLIWQTLNSELNTKNVHTQAGLAVDVVLKSAVAKKSFDNLSGIFIGFYNWFKAVSQDGNASPVRKKVSFNLDKPKEKKMESNDDKNETVSNTRTKQTSNSNQNNSINIITNDDMKIKNGLTFKSKMLKAPQTNKLKLNSKNFSYDLDNNANNFSSTVISQTPILKNSKVHSSFIKSAKFSIKNKQRKSS